MSRTNLPKVQPVIEDDKVYEVTLQEMEQTIVKATDLTKAINNKLILLKDELNKLEVGGVEELVMMFSMSRLRTIDKLLKP